MHIHCEFIVCPSHSVQFIGSSYINSQDAMYIAACGTLRLTYVAMCAVPIKLLVPIRFVYVVIK